MELDHVFICVAPRAREAETLKNFGLTEGSANRHRGQGTSCRRFFFTNAYLELIYLDNPAEIQSVRTLPTKLHERLIPGRQKVSPFGVGFRPRESAQNQSPFPSWNYKPDYLSDDLAIAVGTAAFTEPMWFYISFGLRPDALRGNDRQPLSHPVGFTRVTSIRITALHVGPFSTPAISAREVNGIELVGGEEHLLEISFDSRLKGRSHDFRPLLPLVFRW